MDILPRQELLLVLHKVWERAEVGKDSSPVQKYWNPPLTVYRIKRQINFDSEHLTVLFSPPKSGYH